MTINHHSPDVIEPVVEKEPSSSFNSDFIEDKEHLAASQYDTISGQLPKLSVVGSNTILKNENGPRAGEELEADIPLAYRLIAFSMILFFATGSSYMQSVASPLKSTYKEKLNINNAQYSTIASASSLVNTIFPVIGGIAWPHSAVIVSSIFVLVGAIIAAAASNAENYGMLIGGLILMGFGSTVIKSTQSKLYSHWFRGSSLGLVFSVDIAWNRITSFIAKNTAVPMSTINVSSRMSLFPFTLPTWPTSRRSPEVLSIIPIFLTPATGFFFDKIGWRMPFVSFTGALYIIVFALVGLTTVHPLCSIPISH
ncbi:hypothetical protein J007_02080 [Cryptococcus neoformans]|nr:hypothetical protein J007_02080 [Cryptococcus neoformans var. grubii]